MINKLQEIKKVIWKANPSILELKFGCEIIMLDCDGEPWKVVYVCEHCVFFKDKNTGDYIEENVEKILGRQITLADVLLVMSRTHIIELEKKTIELLRIWILSQNLSNQPPEVINFLHDLICK